ncbi:YitT family protein [Solibacillus daqui]|uniref:YitT family protein n=1 Tax=Solibacillus daqui TaxID=2912187 RepID=UPI002365FE2B|nr:YitT family protein [Solibacillus daqui]
MYYIKKGIAILIGSILIAVGINVFITPYEILDGGIIGLSLILYYTLHLKIGLMTILLSVPIFILAWFKSKIFFYNSLHGLLISSFIIDILKPLRSLLRLDPILSSILGGIFVGLGIGIMLRFKTSTGGTDLLAQFISNKTNINVGILIFLIDLFVIVLGGLLLSTDTLLLSVITILCIGITTSFITSRHTITFVSRSFEKESLFLK